MPSPTSNSTADDLAAVRLDADPDATGPHSQTIRALLGGACAGCRVRPASVEFYDALRTANSTITRGAKLTKHFTPEDRKIAEANAAESVVDSDRRELQQQE